MEVITEQVVEECHRGGPIFVALNESSIIAHFQSDPVVICLPKYLLTLPQITNELIS